MSTPVSDPPSRPTAPTALPCGVEDRTQTEADQHQRDRELEPVGCRRRQLGAQDDEYDAGGNQRQGVPEPPARAQPGRLGGAALAGEDFDSVTRGVFSLPKVGANAFAQGAPIYWDNAAKLCTSTAAGNTKVGVATAAAGAGAGFVNARLNGSF